MGDKKTAIADNIADLSEFRTLNAEELIAPHPAEPRDSARLMVLNRKSGEISHSFFRDICNFLRPLDCLVLNKSRVRKVGLRGRKETGGKVDLLLIKAKDPECKTWTALSGKISPGNIVIFEGGNRAKCLSREAGGSFIFEFSAPADSNYLDLYGKMPLPRYIIKSRKKLSMTGAKIDDDRDYQTVYAGVPGSIAAPTAGFHFTGELLEKLKEQGIKTVYTTLHIGWGTFKPVRASNPEKHLMLGEECHISGEDAEIINQARASGNRIIPVGTSSMRALETFYGENGMLGWGSKTADIFIYTGYGFKTPDAFITNFHLPDSAPLYMAAAFAGRENLLKAYSEAVSRKYRFYSYGDAMMIV